jgi:hypothetical protein
VTDVVGGAAVGAALGDAVAGALDVECAGVIGRGAGEFGGLETWGGAVWLVECLRGWGGRATQRCTGTETGAGARPETTDGGSDESPIPGATSWLADQATVAVATMPSTAAPAHNIVRRVTVTSSYCARR